MILDIIMPVHNNLSYTKHAVNNLYQNTYSKFRLIVIDDASTDGTQEYFKNSSFNNLSYIRFDNHIGVNKAWNEGIKNSQSDILAFVNNDILFAPNWDKALVDNLSDDVWLTSPYVTVGELPKDFPEGKDRKAYDILPFAGFCFVIKKEFFDKYGYFPADKFKYWFGDTWIALQFEAIRKEIKQIPQSYIHHFGGKTLLKIPNIEKILVKERNNMPWLFKNINKEVKK